MNIKRISFVGLMVGILGVSGGLFGADQFSINLGEWLGFENDEAQRFAAGVLIGESLDEQSAHDELDQGDGGFGDSMGLFGEEQQLDLFDEEKGVVGSRSSGFLGDEQPFDLFDEEQGSLIVLPEEQGVIGSRSSGFLGDEQWQDLSRLPEEQGVVEFRLPVPASVDIDSQKRNKKNKDNKRKRNEDVLGGDETFSKRVRG